MTTVHTLAIVLNCRESSDIYKEIYSPTDLLSILKDESKEHVEEVDEPKRNKTMSFKSRRLSKIKIDID